ncbi:MAG: insulinase family protein [Caulobacterales bacterium]|nr:insulinase family protein [Caulobacterales bacterium]
MKTLLTHASGSLALLIAACGAPAEVDPPAPAPAAIWPHEQSDLQPDPAVRYGRLDNGLRYAVMENDTPSGTAAARLRFDVGSLHEQDDQQGLAHFLEHMAFNGSENVPEGEMVKILERHGLAFGADTNASTGFSATTYMLDLPAVDEETLDSVFFLLRETADKLLLEDAAIDRERGVVLSEERISNTYGLRAFKAQQAFLLPSARTTVRLPIGLVEVLEEAGRDRFADMYAKFYRPERAFFVFVGDVPADVIEARIADSFADWTGTGEPGRDPDRGAVEARGLEAAFFHDPDIPTRVTLAWPRPYEAESDTAAARAERLPLILAIGALDRRLARLARAEDAPFLGAGADISDFEETADIASLIITAEPDDWRGALAAGEQELRRALEHGFTEAEVAEQVANLRESLKTRAEQADTRRSDGLSYRIIGALDADQVFTHPRADLARVEPLLDAMTPQAVHAALREEWGTGEPLLFLTSNRELDAPEEALLAAYAESRAVEVAPPDPEGAGEFAYAEFGAPGAIVSRSEVDDLGVTQVVFANNARLNVKVTDHEDAVARMRVRVGRGGLELPADQPGLDVFLDTVFVRAGLEAHSADALDTLTAGSTVDLRFTAQSDAFRFGAEVEPDDLLFQLQLWAAFLAHPGYRAEAEAYWRRVIPTWYETLDATPQAVRRKEVGRVLASGDPRFGIPAQETLEARSLAEAAAGFERARTDGAVEIGVVGDVDLEAVISAVAATYGALPERNAEPADFPEARRIAFPDGAVEPITLRHAGEPNRALALTHWRAVDDADAQRARRLRLLARVLDRKLIDVVREEFAATYSPSARVSLSPVFPDYGYFVASLDLEPGRVTEFFAVIDRIAADMVAGDITEDELERARRPLLERLEERLEDNRYWLSLVDTAQTEPDRLQRHREDQAGYEAITLEELREAAAAYLRPDAAVRIAILPPSDAG